MSIAPNADDERLFASSFKSVPDMWLHRCHSTPSGEALSWRTPDGWSRMTWGEAEVAVRDVANGLLSLGVEREQRCCILAETSAPWILADLGILCAGAATTTIFPGSPADEIAYIVQDCAAVVLIVDTLARLAEVLALRERLPSVRHFIVLDGEPIEERGVLALGSLQALGRAFAAEHPDAYESALRGIEPDSLATLMYTSGTTGEPKGVMLTHDAWVYEAAAIDALGLVSPADKQFLFLPLSHVFAKVLQVIFIRLGVPTVVDGDTDTLLDNLGQTQPTWMGAVPRVFEKAYDRIVAEAKASGPVGYKLFEWALGVGRQVSRLRQARREPSGLLRWRFHLADRLVFQKVKERFGGRIRFFVSGGAPLPRDIAEFFHACDLLVLEGYGLTESSAASCFNTPEDYVFGTVGRPVPGTEVRVGDEGELLLRGRGLMRGYHQRDDETAAALFHDERGRAWLRTGDIGEVLPTGHVRITDRKKELIITSGGKNIAPAQFTNKLRGRCPLVGNVLVHGDRRPFCVALIAVDEESAGRWADARGLVWNRYADLAALPALREEIDREVEAVNAELGAHATVRRFAMLRAPLTVEDGTLTPSLKVKRHAVEARYQTVLDALYEGTPSPD